MALFPFVLVRRPNPDAVLLNHERIHLRQQLELLVVPFYIWYLTEYLMGRWQGLNHYAAYRNISFEQEAYTHEAEFGYLKSRNWWAFLRWV